MAVNQDKAGNLGISDNNLSIAKEDVLGQTHINKFGAAINGLQTTPTDIWDRADASATQQLWVAPTQTRIHAIISTSDEDSDTGGSVAQGDGARTIRIYGLTDWDTAQVSEDVIMDGTNPVNTSNSYVIIHRMKVLTAGDLGPNVGAITAIANTDTSITAQISIGFGQTLMAVFGVPSIQTVYITNYYFNLHDNASPAIAATADYFLLVNESPDIDETLFLTKHTGGLVSLGSNEIQHRFIPYKRFIGPCLIKMQADGSTADLYASSGFDVILVTNEV